MSSVLPLGSKFNLGRSASGGNVRFNLRNSSGILFVVDTPAAASTLTINEANAATGGTSQALAVGLAGVAATGIPFVYTQLNGVWTRQTTGSAGAVYTVSGTPDLLAVYVTQGALSDGFAYLSANHSAKAVTAIIADLDVQRFPQLLQNVSA
jgi:hypothetical protein